MGLYLLGILFIFGGITDYIKYIFALTPIFGILFSLYLSKKYPDQYRPLSFNIWDKIFVIFVIIFIIGIFLAITFYN